MSLQRRRQNFLGAKIPAAPGHQTLALTASSLETLFLLPGNNGKISFKVSGDERFDYLGTLDYGSNQILPPKAPEMSLTCVDGTQLLSTPPPPAFTYFSKDAQSDADKLSKSFQTQRIDCDTIDDLPRCMSDAATQKAQTGHAKIDVAYVIDATGSMWDDIRLVKRGVETVTSAVAAKIPDARFGVVTFLDAGDPYVAQKALDLSGDVPAVKSAIEAITTGGGGDFPEAHLDGAMLALDTMSWRADADLRVAVVITDASFHDPAPSGATLQAVIDKAVAKGILIVPIVVGF
jgi:hypothetical protein